MSIADMIMKESHVPAVKFQISGNFKILAHENSIFAIKDLITDLFIRIYSDIDNNYLVFMINYPGIDTSHVYKFVNLKMHTTFYNPEPHNPETMYNPACIEKFSESDWYLEISADWYACRDKFEKDEFIDMGNILSKYTKILVSDPVMMESLHKADCCDDCDCCDCECCDDDDDDFDDPIVALEEDMDAPRYSANDVMKMIENMHKNREV